jgi:hypothetical protein
MMELPLGEPIECFNPPAVVMKVGSSITFTGKAARPTQK